MNIKNNMGKLFALFTLSLLSFANIYNSTIIAHFTHTVDELMFGILHGSPSLYILVVCLILIIFPLGTILLTSDAFHKNTRITKQKQYVYILHMVYCFFVSHLLNFLLATFFNVHFDKMTNNPISFLVCSFEKFETPYIHKVQCLFLISSALLTSLQYLQHFIVGECTALSILLSRRIGFLPQNLYIMNDLMNCYMYHVVPNLLIYGMFLIRLYFVTGGYLSIVGIMFYSIATSNISIMSSLLLYWFSHGTILTANRNLQQLENART